MAEMDKIVYGKLHKKRWIYDLSRAGRYRNLYWPERM